MARKPAKKTTFEAWVTDGLAQPGKTGTELARLLGLPPPRVAEMKNGVRKPKASELKIISEYLGRALPEELMPTPSETRVPLVSWVSAGSLKDTAASQAHDSVVPLSLGKGTWVAFKVDGDSMDRISPPGSLILVNTAEKHLVPNGCYVICAEDGSGSYKRFRPNPNRFEPVSTNPSHEPLFPNGTVTVVGRVRKTILEM